MPYIQLYRDGKEILATDGIMHTDGRLSMSSTILAIQDRNRRFAKHFPHKIATAFNIYRGKIGSGFINHTPMLIPTITHEHITEGIAARIIDTLTALNP